MSSLDAHEPPQELLIRRDGPIVTLQLNRPERRHALSLSLLQQLEQSLATIAQDTGIRVVVIASEGAVFSSGHDLGEMRACSAVEYRELFETCSRVMLALRSLPQPVLARVQGLATAAGCQLVAASDLAVAAEEARFATPGVKIGLFCTTPMVPLVRTVPPRIAMEMLLTGRPITAREALAAGLVNRVVPADQLDAAVRELADAIIASSPMTVALGKREFYRQIHLGEAAAYSEAVNAMVENALRHDAQEGITAFLEKRSPQWQGR